MLKTGNLQAGNLRGIIQTAQPHGFAPLRTTLEFLQFGCVHHTTLQGQTLH